MSAAVQPPSIPPRPSRSQEKAPTSSTPMVPPRPAHRKVERSLSPSRFAPSPLNESPLRAKSPRASRFGANGHNGDDRRKSVDLPAMCGEEGMEYASLAEEIKPTSEQPSGPEHTRTVGDDIKLHAPKPSLPAVSAKQRVMAVTRTDSDRAASFGIGRPSSNDDSTAALPSNRSLKKKASTTSQLSNTESHIDDEHGIPEIGIQVPMYPNAGDVQAPSPAPTADSAKPRHHARKTSSRGNLPPGSYGLHGHGVAPQDKLEKAYYEKHPDLLKKEITPHHHDRPNDFSMSKEDLNKIVRETASRGSGLAVKNYTSTPSENIAWQALEETTSRVTSPRPASTDIRESSAPSFKLSDADRDAAGIVHVEDNSRRRSVMFSDSSSLASEAGDERPYTAPILAEDEIAKDPSPYAQEAAVEPSLERRGSAFEMEEPVSRPTSRPASLYKEASFEMRSTPLEDVEEYEPLFDEDEKVKKLAVEEKIKKEHKRRFPSADVWEDAPSSVHYTAEVSTPEPSEEQAKAGGAIAPPPGRDGETPAQAFARHQEELAEKEAREGGPECFLPGRKKEKPSWVQHQPHLVSSEPAPRPSMAQRFPSRDVWEDAPDSAQLETTVSTPQQDAAESPVETSKPELPTEKPTVPQRPKPRQGSGDGSKPVIPERPKPQIPARPAKAGPTSGGLEPAEAAAPPKPKPAVPARPTGSKIAALQAGFMNDLNQRLRLGPQAPKKVEPAAEEEPVEEKEKAPLADARKGRARGPQRRAPAKSASPAPAKVEPEEPKFVFSQAVTFFELDPEEDEVSAGAKPEQSEISVEAKEEPESSEVVEEKTEETKPEEKEEEVAEEPAKEETQSLVTNLAGEPIVTEDVKKSGIGLPVEPVKVEEK
ncbi:altered inheritance of mitochondria protein 21 [Podospora aff. communis PSN243]|uniref:Altered inheritance of mitochondria protein 21 n=1 Tax=Podospora aff. communis PSN243 TaxID=3040156 RepID=A0AAV9H3B4_9PEZI|nr:altered inheritance of mitochondria protein 21 [Podospora aff. communis PSN243]